MYQLLFKNRFNALVFVAITLFSVRILVGTPGDSGAIHSATTQLGVQTPGVEEAGPESRESAEARARAQAFKSTDNSSNEAAMGFASDEELIDDAQGFDPVGFSADPLAEDEAERVVFVDGEGVE